MTHQIKQSTTNQAKHHSSFSDPSFASNKQKPIHRWVPWIAGFSSDFVQQTIKTFLPNKGTVLDPFCGVGTTLVEAMLLGHHAIGFEINPYAALATRVKVHAYKISVKSLYAEITNLQSFYEKNISSNYIPKSTAPAGFKTRSEFYSPKVLHKVLIVQDFIDSINDPSLRDFFRLAFASTMVRYSNYSYEPSLGRRVSAGKAEILDFPVGETIIEKLLEMTEDVEWVQENLPKHFQDANIYNTSFFNHRRYIHPNSIDLVVTSPPYLNNYHYNRNTRPQLYWLGYAKQPQDIKPLEFSNFGKYWQTVRNAKNIELKFSISDTDLEEKIQLLRKINPEKGVYGGEGWANYAISYFNDSYDFLQSLKLLLKPQGSAIIVIGNSILQGIMIPTDRYLGEIAQLVGLELVRIEVPRAERVGNSIIQSNIRVGKTKKSHQLYESIVELRKVI